MATGELSHKEIRRAAKLFFILLQENTVRFSFLVPLFDGLRSDAMSTADYSLMPSNCSMCCNALTILTGPIPVDVFDFSFDLILPATMALRLTLPLTEMSTRNLHVR
jgi:hypothetical protein